MKSTHPTRMRLVPGLLALAGLLSAPRAGAQAAPNLFRDATLGTLNPAQPAKDALFPMTTIEQSPFNCGARFTNDGDLLSTRPIIFYDVCNVNNSIRVSKAVDHLVVDCVVTFADTLSGAPPADSRSADARFTFSGNAGGHLCALDGATATPCSSPKEYHGLAEGVHRLAIYGVDGEGKPHSGMLYDWRVDTAAPPAPEVALEPVTRGNARAAVVTGRAEPGARVGVSVRDGDPLRRPVSGTVVAGESGLFRVTLDLSGLNDGPLTAGAVAIDRAGNVSRIASAAADKRTAAPPAPAPATGPSAPLEAAACLSPDPSQWPARSKPYFLILVSTSGSMSTTVGAANSCGYNTSGVAGNSSRIDHARCAVRNLINVYAGEANFGLMSYTWKLSGCPAGTCGVNFSGCSANYAPADNNFCGPFITEPSISQAVHSGAYLDVPLLQDHYWSNPPAASNVPQLQAQVDNSCTGSVELGSNSNKPLGGALFNANRYLAGSYVDPFTGAPVTTPIGPATSGGLPAERTCRPISVILLTDGDENCDTATSPTPLAGGCRAGQGSYLNTANERLASYEADRLYTQGVTVDGQIFRIKTYVVNFIGGTATAGDNIAACGGTGTAYTASNEPQLAQSLSAIVGGALKPEVCDNLDNDCNGCTDEGFNHYADVQPVPANCCAWGTPAQRTTCLSNYQASITPALPQGNKTLLPCTTAAQAAAPATWLCYDPGERCDNVDNNGNGTVDEGQIKCGSPLHCPTAEVCNGVDDNCNGLIDEGGVCANGCIPSPEVCDGCDNDCDGIADNGVAPAACGGTGPGIPANCAGFMTCRPPQAVPVGGCVAGGGWNACSATPQPETCGDGLDNNCNGAQDDGNPACPYGGRTEVCNGIDDNCNGLIDEGVTPPPGALQSICGVSPSATSPECTAGVTISCTGGAWKCNFPAGVCNAPGGCAATAEICDALDNNCDGRVNENVDGYGQICHSDDGSPIPGDGPCRTTGSYICNGPNAVICSATKDLTQAGPELCDGIDNDCDGLIDEPYTNKGSNATYFVKPEVTKVAASLWVYSYEATRPKASASSPGAGNGYWCQAFNAGDPNCNNAAIPVAPAGVPLDKTPACSGPLPPIPTYRVPWTNVTPVEAEQTCKAMGGHLCTTAEWQTACLTNPPSGTNCTLGYNPRGAACMVPFTASKYCNLAVSYDTDPGTTGDQDALLVAGSSLLQNCWADWSNLQGNTASTNRIFDLTGNLREFTKQAANNYPVMGGSYLSQAEDGATCSNTFDIVNTAYQLYDAGFRCCFTADPTL